MSQTHCGQPVVCVLEGLLGISESSFQSLAATAHNKTAVTERAAADTPPTTRCLRRHRFFSTRCLPSYFVPPDSVMSPVHRRGGLGKLATSVVVVSGVYEVYTKALRGVRFASMVCFATLKCSCGNHQRVQRSGRRRERTKRRGQNRW